VDFYCRAAGSKGFLLWTTYKGSSLGLVRVARPWGGGLQQGITRVQGPVGEGGFWGVRVGGVCGPF